MPYRDKDKMATFDYKVSLEANTRKSRSEDASANAHRHYERAYWQCFKQQ
ncbi:MAG TPA: hypothetical protein VEC12_10425 [Bacteroidia bacterium]|nr:hypothetical protein [Bacteroidia bacterium]